jgi:L-rhamnose isomerase / sugar isomerase
MLDQSQNAADPIESLMGRAIELQRARAQVLRVDRDRLAERETNNDAMLAAQTLSRAYHTDVQHFLAQRRLSKGCAIDPLEFHRHSGYRSQCARRRPRVASSNSGIK